MSRDARFWRNVILIGVAHVSMFVGLVRWSRDAQPPARSDIVWMSGGIGDGTTMAAAASAPSSVPSPTPETRREEIVARDEVENDSPLLTSAKSDIHLSTPTPKPTPVATPTPSPAATEAPKPSATPKASPKVTPKPSPKPTAKKAASPKPTVKPVEQAEDEDEIVAKELRKKIAKALAAKKASGDSPDESSAGTTKGSGSKAGSGGSGGQGSGTGNASAFSWYTRMLHDRFYSEWVQPTSVVPSGSKISALVKIRIEQDGRVSDFSLVRPSGNVVVDESVSAVAKQVTKVDPLPKGLGGEHYDVKINFEINLEH